MTRVLALAAAALLAPAAAAAATTYSGTTSQGTTITFDADGDRVSNVVSSLAMVCTDRAGIEPYLPSGAFTADGAESKLTELRKSAVLNRDATHNFTFTGTIEGGRATGKIALNYATTDFDVLTMTTKITVCDSSAAFTATADAAPASGAPDAPKGADQPAQPGAKAKGGKKKHKKKRKRKRGARRGA
jgi:hypothetical protein